MFRSRWALYYGAARLIGVADVLSEHRCVVPPLRAFADHDRTGGHADARHIAKSLRYLSSRLALNANLSAVSTFWNERSARLAVNYAVTSSLSPVLSWLSNASNPNRHIIHTVVPLRGWIGIGLTRNPRDILLLRSVRLVLERVTATDFYIVTAYPV